MRRTSDSLSLSETWSSFARGAERDPASMGKERPANLQSSHSPSYRQVMLLCWCLLLTRRCATASWVDPDTPSSTFHTVSKSSTDSRQFRLVRSGALLLVGASAATSGQITTTSFFCSSLPLSAITFCFHRYFQTSLNNPAGRFMMVKIRDGQPSTRMIVRAITARHRFHHLPFGCIS